MGQSRCCLRCSSPSYLWPFPKGIGSFRFTPFYNIENHAQRGYPIRYTQVFIYGFPKPVWSLVLNVVSPAPPWYQQNTGGSKRRQCLYLFHEPIYRCICREHKFYIFLIRGPDTLSSPISPVLLPQA